MKKRFLSIFLAFAMALALLPGTALAEENVASPEMAGSCGANAIWAYDENTYTLSIEGSGQMSNYGGENVVTPWKHLKDQIKHINVGGTVTNVGDYAFCAYTNLSSVSLSDNVTSIGRNAFSGCKSLVSINNPDSIVSIGAGAFSDCGITSFVIPNGVTEIETSTFQWCINLANIVIPNGVTSIGSHAFQFCASLTSVDIPESVTSIGEGAFNNSGLVSINIPAGVTFNDRIPFYNCTNLLAINVQDGSLSYTSVDGVLFSADMKTMIRYPAGKSATSYTVPDGVTDISTAFRYCSSLTSINIPVSVTDTGNWGFGGCDNLKDIYYGGSKEQWLEFGGRRDLLTSWVITIHFADDAYTITYAPNGGSGSMNSMSVVDGESYTLPKCGFTAPAGKEFKAWQINGEEYAPGSTYTVTADTTITAVWQTIPPVEYTLTGTITGHQGVIYTLVTAQLVGLNGSTYSAEVGAGVVDKTGKTEYVYTVSAPAGQYNLNVVAETDQGGVVNRTAVVKLTGNGQTQNINLPNGQAKAKVENKVKTAALVGGLDELIIDADGEVTGEVTLTIDNADKSSPSAAAIQSAASGQTLEFMDISITKSENGVESAVTDTGDVTVEIVLTFERTGKSDITVYRYHDGSVDTLTAQASGNGEKIEVDDDSIAIYAKKFSVYAIGYTVSATDPVTPTTPATPTNPTAPSRPSSSSTSSGPSIYSISIPTSITGGMVTVRPTSASAGSKVTITATPNSGYELDTLTVTDSSGKRVSLTNQGNNQYAFTMPSGSVTVDAVFRRTWSNPFADVTTSAWYYDAVKFVNQNELMNGVGNGLFSPGTNLSRAMLSEILYNKEGKPIVTAASSFSDVAAGAWYANAVTWAAANKVVGGYGNGLFGPGDDITREQVAVMLYRYAGTPDAHNLLLNFTDAYEVSDWAQDAVCWAVDQGILNGKGNGILDPTGKATRAEAAQMLKNYLEK